MGKEQFHQPDYSRKVAGVKFTVGSAELIRQVGHIQVINSKFYEDLPGKYKPAPYGPLDTRLGTFQKSQNCETCGLGAQDCIGHFGFIDLEQPVFHVGFFKLIIQVLQCICKNCAGTLLTGEKKTTFLRQFQNPHLDYLRRKALHKKVIEASRKALCCSHCGFQNGVVKKAVGAVLKIVHAAYIPVDQFQEAQSTKIDNKEFTSMIANSKFDLLDPTKVLSLFRRINQEDFTLLMVRNDDIKNPADMIITRIPVPPVVIRPAVISDIKAGSTEDDLTMKLSEILNLNEHLKKHKQGAPINKVNETWDHLQIQCGLYINSEMSGLPPDMQPKKFIRSFAQRLKGKNGRFRGNLSGKRVDFTARTVISPDPNLRIDQVGVPIHVAKTLTFPEVVNQANIEYLRKLVINGEQVHPGAAFVSTSGGKKSLKYGNRELIAKNLQIGDTVERHLVDNDIVLFNRQPSLHKISIMAHRAKVMPYKTFRFNECACTPYNADFDGDEMNLHFPQTYEARAEASCLMGIKSNLVTPRSGEPLIAAIQDFITAAYLLTHKDTFLSRSEVYRMVSSLIDISAKTQKRIKIPPPAIRKPRELWTGKQLIELIIAPEMDSPIRLNLSTKNKSYTKDFEFCLKDSYVIIRNNVLLSGVLDKSLVGASSKTNIFYILLRDYGDDAAVDAMWRLARMSPVFLSNRGFSIGIGDVKPSYGLLRDKSQLLNNGYLKCDNIIADIKSGKLKAHPGCTEFETLEALVLRELSAIRDRAGTSCKENLSTKNAPLIMAISGSKGSFINISQMIACVGQQAISGKRPPDGFENRSLPHFPIYDRTPHAKGFVENSFYSGLTPIEFFFHTMAGREGLVDTAVKTAETGYMQRRLVKCLEDLAANYDKTVRTSSGEIVQFIFGEDGLDPSYMESNDEQIIDFEHVMQHVRNTHKHVFDSNSHLETEEMVVLIENLIEQNIEKEKYLKFCYNLKKFINKFLESTEKYFKLPESCSLHRDKKPIFSPERRRNTRKKTDEEDCEKCEKSKKLRQTMIEAHCLNHTQAAAFIEMCAYKLKRAIVEPGTAVGAIAATSIGEPSTQMTLKTFHFAGVASMNITQGVPRIKEIINAVKNISTPIITVALVNDRDEKLARRVKARIEKTTLGEISEYIEQVFLPDDCFVLVKLNPRRIRLLQLEITMDSIARSLCSAKLPVPIKEHQVRVIGKSIIQVRVPEKTNKCSTMMAMHTLKYHLQSVVVKGLPNITRCMIHADEKQGDTYKLLVEGTDYKDVLAIPEIDGKRTLFNNANIVAEVLGIEAARTTIIKEILSTMEGHGIGLDRRHVMLLADLMTYRGEVLGITRNGLVKMKESVLLLASFERTMDHLFDAAFYGQQDNLVGVSESIIMGAPMSIGTGMFKLLQQRGPVPSPSALKRPTIFETPEFNLRI